MMSFQDSRIRITTVLVLSALALGLIGSPRGAENPPASHAAATASGTPLRGEAGARDLRASKVIGMKVRNAQDESLGKIDDLIVDVHNGRVAYAVLSSGGALGVGQKLCAYPLALFQPAAGRSDELVLNVDKDKLNNAPGFERKHWPDWNKDSYRGDVDRHFGPMVVAQSLPKQRLERASELIGRDVDDANDHKAGELADLVVNIGTAQLHYAVLDFDKSWTTGDRLMPLSMRTLDFPEKRNQHLKLNLAKSDLDMAYAFNARKWPDVGDPAYRQRIDSYLQHIASMPRSTGQAGRPAQE